MMPKLTLEVADYTTTYITDVYEGERNMIQYMSSKESIEELKKLLEPSEFNLLCERFVEGKTVRELEPEMGITAETIVVRTNNILDKIARHKNRILKDETNTAVEKTEQGRVS